MAAIRLAAAQRAGEKPKHNFPSHLAPVRHLGSGSYGQVTLCEDRRTGQQVAVKHLKHAVRHGKSILREIYLLSRLKHDNLLQLLDFAAVPGRSFQDVFLVVPFMATDLHKVIHSAQTLSDRHVQVMMCQLLRGLSHLHAAGVAHRDLKPANVLLTADCHLKIGDFGLARGDMNGERTCSEAGSDAGSDAGMDGPAADLTEYVVTRWYRAPEVMLLPRQYDTALDIWSAGCILCEMLGRKAIFPGKNHIDMICRVAGILGSPSSDQLDWLPDNTEAAKFLRQVCPPGAQAGVPFSRLYPKASAMSLDLARQMLDWHPRRRPTAKEAQAHEWLVNLMPRKPAKDPEPFDWTFDNFRATAQAVQDRLYAECARFHPEILERDRIVEAASRPPAKPLLPRAESPPPAGKPAVVTMASLKARLAAQQAAQQRASAGPCGKQAAGYSDLRSLPARPISARTS